MTSIDPRALRDAFGSFMTGVTVVTTLDHKGDPVGFTANSFSSVSLDPPLLLICPGKFLSSHDVFAKCSHFAVNILSEGQREVSNTFASYKGDRFAKVDNFRGVGDLPLIQGALAQFCCETHTAVPAGDHTVLIGRVEEFSHARGNGLGYVGGSYFSLGLEREIDAKEPTICGALVRSKGHVLLEVHNGCYRPLRIAGVEPGGQRNRLAHGLADRGVPARVDQVYSSFSDAGSGLHYTFFLASCHGNPTVESAKWVPVDALPKLTYTTQAIHDMMTRFAVEAQEGNFSLYLGDAKQGDIHSLNEGAR